VAEKQEKILVDKIMVGEHEQRVEDDPEQFAELVNSIGAIGLINPIVVAETEGGFKLVAGHRRLAAIKKLGYSHVFCTVRDMNDAEASEVTFAENFCRRPLTPIEQAAAIKDCYEKGIMTLSQMAKAFHRSENWCAAQMDMCNWPEDVLFAIHDNLISVSAAHNLAVIDDDVYRRFLLQSAVDGGSTARTTAAWLQAWRSQKPAEEAITAEPVEFGHPQAPLIPQMPCLSCGQVHRMDQLSHVPMCQDCINVIRNV